MTALAPLFVRLTRRIAIVAVPLVVLLAGYGGTVAQEHSAEDDQTTQIAANQLSSAAPSGTRAERSANGSDASHAPPRSTGEFRKLWAQGDFVARATLVCLAVMLVGGAYVVARRLWDQHVLLASAQKIRRSFWSAPNLYEAVRNLERHSPFRAIAEDGLEAATHREGRLTDRIAADEWIVISLRRSVRAIEARLDAGLSFVSAVGATAPFIGLLGTVWGTHVALTDASGAPVGVAVGAALPTTAAGLGVAVLAMLAARWLARRNTRAAAAVHEFAADVQAVLLAADALVAGARGAPSRALPPG